MRLRGLILVGVCAAAIATAPTAVASPATDSDVGYGNGVPTVVSGRPVPTMNGVPCVGGHLGTCISFAQNQPPRRTPYSRVGHSPTVQR